MKTAFNIDLRIFLRWILGVLLIWAALSKLANVQEFFLALVAYRLPGPLIIFKVISIILPWLELLTGLMLLAGIHVLVALLWAAILFGIFVLATGQAWARGLNISCGCLHLDFFGVDANAMGLFLESPAFACLRALVLCAGAIYLFRASIAPRGVYAEPAAGT